MKILLTTDTHYGFDGTNHQKIYKFFQKISKLKFDVMIHTGDWISHKQSQWIPFLEIVRKFVKKPIYGVRGNHCFWDMDEFCKSFKEMTDNQKEYFKKYDIVDLNDNIIEEGNILICGFDGWYGGPWHRSKDAWYIPEYNNDEFHNRAHNALNKLLELDVSNKKSIIATHFSPLPYRDGSLNMSANPEYLKLIAPKFDYFLIGHSHLDIDIPFDKCRILNAGSDYNLPKYKIFEV